MPICIISIEFYLDSPWLYYIEIYKTVATICQTILHVKEMWVYE